VAAVHHSITEINLYVQEMLHVFTAQFLYPRITVKSRIKTQFFAHIIVNAISPHLNLRFTGRELILAEI
jgi:hypothetical protein